MYGCETWSLALKEKYKMGASEKRLLMRIFGPEAEKETGD
jgi:hypothetical protein